jgi:hypothetical protein
MKYLTFAAIDKPVKTSLALICFAFLLQSCVQMRQLTYPETFTWIGADNVSNSMRSMAMSVAILDNLILEETQPGANREAILRELENIEYTASELSIRTPAKDNELAATNHLLMDDHIEDFLEDVLRARIQVQARL